MRELQEGPDAVGTLWPSRRARWGLPEGLRISAGAGDNTAGTIGVGVKRAAQRGAGLGGLSGADAHCQKPATAAGAGGRTWRACLNTSGAFATPTTPVGPPSTRATASARGPWFNAKGELIASDLAHLRNGNNIGKATALDEKGNVVKGRGDTPNEHDMLTGSRSDGTAFAPQTDTTCGNWTKSGDGSAILGHHDRSGPLPEAWAKSWNVSHQSAGRSQEALVLTSAAGRFYCLAAN